MHLDLENVSLDTYEMKLEERGYQKNSHFQNFILYVCFAFAFRLILVDADPGPRDLDSCNLILLLKIICILSRALPSAVSSSILRQKLLTDKEERVYYVLN